MTKLRDKYLARRDEAEPRMCRRWRRRQFRDRRAHLSWAFSVRRASRLSPFLSIAELLEESARSNKCERQVICVSDSACKARGRRGTDGEEMAERENCEWRELERKKRISEEREEREWSRAQSKICDCKANSTKIRR